MGTVANSNSKRKDINKIRCMGMGHYKGRRLPYKIYSNYGLKSLDGSRFAAVVKRGKLNTGGCIMAAITFDTLKYANRLKSAGVPDKQAEAEAEALSEALEVNLKELVTKEDLHREIESLRREMHSGFIQVEQRLVIKLGGLMALSIGIVAALVKLL